MEKLIFDYSKKGNIGVSLPGKEEDHQSPSQILPDELLRKTNLNLPEVSEPEVVRHFTKLSSLNHHVDKGFYPLGSCTMKYNPKINDKLSAVAGLSQLNLNQPESTTQGALQIMYELERQLCEITGMHSATLQPAAGSHGELTGVLVIKKYHESKGENRKYLLVPDSAHGTNPSSAASLGYKTISLKSNEDGCIDLDDLREKMNENVAGLMLTNPNTLGIFEVEVEQIVDIVHSHGGLVYMDGANLNALFGVAKPGDMGFDITHMNLHKTFSTPHGGGGPGSGPVAVVQKLSKFLPLPRVIKKGDKYKLSSDYPESIGRVLGSYGNFNVIVRAYIYLMMLGEDGLKKVTRNAVINANYLKKKISAKFEVPYNTNCMHEFVATGQNHKTKYSVKTLDIAKRLLDFEMHAPTVYFPLIVKEALMIEPTETESKESMDKFIEVMNRIDKEAKEDPELLHNSPANTPVRRLNELKANKELDVCWKPEN